MRIFIGLLIFSMLTTLNAQTRWGMYAGVEYGTTTHTNPYLIHDGSRDNPGPITTFNDRSSRFYVPFGLAAYDENGLYEFSSFALNGLLSIGLALLDGKDLAESTQINTNGLTPLLQDISSNLKGKPIYTQDISAEFVEVDFMRIITTVNNFFGITLPFYYGGQASWSVFGIHHGILSNDILTFSDPQDNGSGLVSFNFNVEAVYGVNLGYRFSFPNDGFMFILAQYDWRTFLEKAGQDYITQGNRLTIEATVFPFDEYSDLRDLFIKGYYRRNNVNYSRKSENIDAIAYSNQTIGLSLNYFIL